MGLLRVARDGWRTHRAIVFAVAITVALTCGVMPFARRQEGATTSFMPAMLAIVACFDILSVFLLVGEFHDGGDRRVLGMAWAYLWSLVLMAGYTFAFPGVIAPHPPFAITPSVAPWLYVGWHTGFPLMLGLAWAPWPRRKDITVAAEDRGRSVVRGAALVSASAVLVVVSVLLAAHRLPVIIHGLDTSRMTTITGPWVLPLVALSLAATVRGSISRVGPERWSSAAVLVCFCDLILTYASHYRFSVGWYVGRTMTLFAAGLILFAMLADFRRVKADAQHNASHDQLTGLFNRRVAHASLEQLIAQARRRAVPLAAILLDLDHFKLVNDEFGHGVGDRLLADVGQALTANVRGGDLLARIGGEEFLLVLPDTDLTGACTVAEKLRTALAGLAVPGLQRPVTGSIGLTRLLPGDLANHLLRRADMAMYRAKNAGRDQVFVIADAEPLLPSPVSASPRTAALTAQP